LFVTLQEICVVNHVRKSKIPFGFQILRTKLTRPYKTFLWFPFYSYNDKPVFAGSGRNATVTVTISTAAGIVVTSARRAVPPPAAAGIVYVAAAYINLNANTAGTIGLSFPSCAAAAAGTIRVVSGISAFMPLPCIA
jgi:hypothetical protein